MKRIFVLAIALFCLPLSGCTAAAFFLSGCGSPEADLVVVNNSGQEVWSITLEYGDETQVTQNAWDSALAGPGESHGLLLEEGTEQVTVVLSDQLGRELAQQTVRFSGDRLYLTLERDGTLSVTEDWPDV